MPNNINRIKIFIDTNKFEVYQGKDLAVLDKVNPSGEFYKLLNFCKDIDNVNLFIPEVVWKEICVHLENNIRNSFNSITSTMELYRKKLGGLVEITLDFKGLTRGEYAQYVEQIAAEFLDSIKDICEIATFEISESKIKEFVDKAVKSISPFTKATSKNKEHSDAGFKDAVIVETLLNCCSEDEICILFTNDTDFNLTFQKYGEENYIAIRDLDEVKFKVNSILKRNDENIVRAIFSENSYTKETLFAFLGTKYDESVTRYEIISVEKLEALYELKVQACINETTYDISVEYDLVANEIVNATYKITND